MIPGYCIPNRRNRIKGKFVPYKEAANNNRLKVLVFGVRQPSGSFGGGDLSFFVLGDRIAGPINLNLCNHQKRLTGERY